MNNNWKSYELGNIVSIYNGSTPSTTNEEFWNGDIIWVTPKDLSDQNQKYISEGERKITRKALSKNKLLPKGTILLSSRAPIGLLSISLTELVTNQGFKNIVVDEKLLNNEFLYYNLKLRKNELNNLGTGTTFKELSKSTLEKFKINLPDLSAQKSIAKILSDLDAKIELNNKINRELEAMAKTLYDYWFVQFDFPNADGKPYKSSGGKMVYNAELKREIPEGWEAGTLGKIAELIRGVTYDSSEIKDENDEDTVPVLRATNITGNVLDLDNMVYVPRQNVSKIQLLNRLDILITMSSGSKEHIGKNGFYYFDKEVSFGAFCAKIVAKKDFRYYLYSYTQSEFMFATIKNECLGTNINNLNGSLVKGFKLVLPPIDLIKKFNEKVQSIYETIGNNHKQNQHLTALRDWLLPMLMNGQVRVKEAEERLSMAAEPSVKYGS